MRRYAAVLLLGVTAALGGCGALDPFPTAPRPSASGPAASAAASIPRVAICYNTLNTPLAAVEAQAQQECDANTPNTLAEPADTDWYLQNCPLLLPARATFVCTPKR